jgi:riboflavin kinase/FMN adenylyltransferase
MRIDAGLPETHAAGDLPVVLSIGNFDGVHRGHHGLIETAVSRARDVGGESMIITFDPHPRCVLTPDRCPERLSTLDERGDLLAAHGVDRMVVLRFDLALSRWSAEHFCQRLMEAFPLRTMVAGPDFALGHKRRGDLAFLRAFGADHGFEVVTVEPVTVDGAVVSSSAIRAALAAGGLDAANRLLGHPYLVDGLLESDGPGGVRLAVPADKCLPAAGVYATWIRVDGGEWQAATTAVIPPPDAGDQRPVVRPQVLDAAGNLGHRALRVAFAARVGDVTSPSGVEPSPASLAEVADAARALLGRMPAPAGV